MTLQLGTSYLPGRVYFRTLLAAEEVMLCGGNPWQKQTLRNRTFILSPNGVQRLIIPVHHSGGETITDAQVKIDYSLPWIREHIGAFEAAYNTSPFFEFFRDDLFAIIHSKPENLFDLNHHILQLLLKKAKTPTKLLLEKDHVADIQELANIQRKQNPEDNSLPSYPQVFAYKFGFVPGLSVLDELANTGRIVSIH